MDNLFRSHLKARLQSYKGTAFQDAIDRIYMCIHGDQNYQRIKQKNDFGSDGIVLPNTVLAIYAPEKYVLTKFKTKIKDDFGSYSKNWMPTYSDWEVVTNLESTAGMFRFVNSLKPGTKIICIDGLLSMIDEQTWTVKHQIFKALDMPERYISYDVILEVVEDIIKVSEKGSKFKKYTKPAYILDKVNLNFSKEHEEAFLAEYESSLAQFSVVTNVIQSRKPEDISAVRNKVSETFMSLSGSFEKRLYDLVSIMAQDNPNDDYYRHKVRIVMIYFFEQCLFGQKPTSEVTSV